MSLGPSGAFGTPSVVYPEISPGFIQLDAGATPPTGWLACNGASYSVGAYPRLFARIGYAFGGSAGNFSVPNMQNNVPMGAGSTYALAAIGGEATHVLTSPEMPSHTHTQNAHTHTYNVGTTSGNSAVGGSGGSTWDENTGSTTGSTTAVNNNTGGGGAHNNLQPYLALNYVIKT